MSRLATSFEAAVPLVANFWGTLSSNQRRLLLVGIGFLAIGIAWLLSPKPTHYTTLLDAAALNQGQLHRIEAALAKAGLDEYQVNAGEIKVPQKLRSKYLAALRDDGALPKAIGEAATDEIRAFNPLETAEHRRLRLQDAHRREVAEVVRSLEGIDEAFVQYKETTTGRFANKQTHVSAMLAVRPLKQAMLKPQLVRTLKNIMVASQPHLSHDSVTIVDLNTGRTYNGRETSLEATDEYLFAKQNFERIYVAKLQRHFEHLVGLRIDANIELQQPQPAVRAARPHWVPTVVSASLAVPKSLLSDVEGGRASFLKQIESAALAVLPSTVSASPPRVAVTVYDDARTAASTQLQLLNIFKSPFGLGITLCFLGLFTALLYSLWKDVAALKRPDTSKDETVPLTPPPVALAHPARVHERLTELVRENPKVAAETITEWVRKAS